MTNLNNNNSNSSKTTDPKYRPGTVNNQASNFSSPAEDQYKSNKSTSPDSRMDVKTDVKADAKTDLNSASIAAKDSDWAGLEDKILEQSKMLGDLLERAGERVKSIGFEKIGTVIHDLGNKIEHFKGVQAFRKSDKANEKNNNVSSGAI